MLTQAIAQTNFIENFFIPFSTTQECGLEVTAKELGYEIDETELANEIFTQLRKDAAEQASSEVSSDDFEAIYRWFLS